MSNQIQKIRDGTITIDTMESKCCPNLKFSVDFNGWNEGSASPLENEEEVKRVVNDLIKRHSKNYRLKIIDNRIKQKTL